MSARSLSMVFPMFNEAENIEEAVHRAVRFASALTDDYEIIIVDDASTDRSAGIVEDLARSNSRIRLFKLKKNTRFGGALAKGLSNAEKEIVLYTDSDFPAKEEDMRKAIALLDEADIVTAYSLVIKDASLKRILMSKGYNFLVRLLFGLKILDANSGLKVYKKEVLKGIRPRSRSPFVDVEIFVEARKLGFSIKQYGLIFDLRTRGKSTISRLDVVARTFWDMFMYRIRLFRPSRRK